jgi:tRNA threonylcarbamoyladenosine biosynthesis protein TsaE
MTGLHGGGETMTSFVVGSRGPDDTARIAAALAGRLVEGDAVIISGGLAAGKTTFVTAVAAALGSTDQVTSPTFSLAQFYTSPVAPILHIDTYRLADIDEYRDLGLAEYAESSITLVEWGETVASEFDRPLLLDFRSTDRGPDERDIVLASAASRWTDVFPDLARELAGGAA